MTMERSVLTILSADRFGVLAKVAACFGARGCNIHTLSVSAGPEQGSAAITVVWSGRPEHIEQVVGRLEKLEDVHKVSVHRQEKLVERALALVVLDAEALPEEFRREVEEYLMRAAPGPSGGLLLELAGPPPALDRCLEALGPLGIRWQSRTGSAVAQ